jgi:hypothetical protein
MKHRKRISALLFLGMGIALACNAAGASETDQSTDPQQPQPAFDRVGEPRSAPPPPGPFRAPLPGSPQGQDHMSIRMDMEPPPHARWNRPEFHRGPLFGTERQQADTPEPEKRPPTGPASDMAGRGWHRDPPPPFQRRMPPWAQDEERTPPPEPEQQTATGAASPDEKAAAPQAPAWAGAPPRGFNWPPAGAQRSPYWRDSRQSPPGLDQSRSPWAPTPEEGQYQQPAGYPPAAYMPPNFPPPPPMASRQPYFYPGQGYSAPAGASPAQPNAVPGYYGTAPWGGSLYSRPYPPPYPYGPGARNW